MYWFLRLYPSEQADHNPDRKACEDRVTPNVLLMGNKMSELAEQNSILPPLV